MHLNYYEARELGQQEVEVMYVMSRDSCQEIKMLFMSSNSVSLLPFVDVNIGPVVNGHMLTQLF